MELGVGTGQGGVRRCKANCPHEAVEKGAQGRGWRMGKVNVDRTWLRDYDAGSGCQGQTELGNNRLRSHRDWSERKKRASKHSDIEEKLGRS